jgi:fructose-1,6-bisphosphatase/inositol monophosphatase family enzyme
MGNVVINAIRKRFPMHKIISSDSITEVPQLTKDPTWIIGPVDGTTNFDAGLPLTCISIGFCVDTKPVIGVVYAPMTNELYLGARGHGSYRNGVKIKERKDVKCLNDAVVNFEFGLGADAARSVKNIMKHGVKSTRCFGSGMLDFCYVATGRLDVVFAGTVVEGWKPWDYCAPYVICREAGCVMESLTDQKPRQELNLYGSAVLCCTSQELLEETRRVALSKKKRADSEKAVKQ